MENLDFNPLNLYPTRIDNRIRSTFVDFNLVLEEIRVRRRFMMKERGRNPFNMQTRGRE